MKRLLKSLKIFFVLSNIFFVPQLIAETLKIQVLEKGTADPIENATIVIKQTNDYDTTDKKGFIEFDDITLPVDIKILNPGYQTLEQKAKTTALTVYIEPLSVEGESIE